MIFYLLSKFAYFKPWTKIQMFGRFDLDFRKTSEQIYLQKTPIWVEMFLESFKVFVVFLEKSFCSRGQILHFSALYQYSITSKIGFRLLTDSKTSL